jgi:hypothetical protein
MVTSGYDEWVSIAKVVLETFMVSNRKMRVLDVPSVLSSTTKLRSRRLLEIPNGVS